MRAIAEIAEQVRTQDNRSTAHPIFVVQQKRVDSGYDPAYTDDDKMCWIVDHTMITKESDPEEWARLEAEYERTGEEGENYRTGYVERWEFVTACFTEQGAQDYINCNGHNLTEPRIYVDSGHRNLEWQALRKLLLEWPKAPLELGGGHDYTTP